MPLQPPLSVPAGPDLRSPILVLAPHPDDETAGVGGLIARAAADRAAIHVLFLTDGAPRRRRYFAHDFRGSRERYRAVRRREAIAAARALGIGEEGLIFSAIPDLELPRQLPRAAAQIGAAIAAVRPRTLLAPAGECGHPDHDAAHQLALWAARRCGGHLSSWEFPLYAWRHGEVRFGWLPPGPSVVVCRLREAEQNAKAQALAAYASQWETLVKFPLQRESLRPLRPHRPRRRAVWREWGWDVSPRAMALPPAKPLPPWVATRR